MKQWPLRIKITLLVGVVLTLACTILTVNSIYSARGYYSVLDETGAKPEIFEDRVEANSTAVSYTHLDVYKRQCLQSGNCKKKSTHFNFIHKQEARLFDFE